MGFALEEILRHPAIWRVGQVPHCVRPGVPTGYEDLDRCLPDGGWPTGALTELLANDEGIGELSLLIPAMRRLIEEGGAVALVSPPHTLFPHALSAKGVKFDRLLVIDASGADQLWATEQALLSGVCRMVVVWTHRIRGKVDYRDLRRLQMAADQGSASCMLYRSRHCGSMPSAAPLRLSISANEGELVVRIIKQRGSLSQAPIRLNPFPPHWRGGAIAQRPLLAQEANALASQSLKPQAISR